VAAPARLVAAAHDADVTIKSNSEAEGARPTKKQTLI